MRAQRSGSRYPVQPPRTSTGPRRRIAVLGGGLGSLSAVFALTEAPDWQDRFEVTIYQIGWRLGGKARSGRNLKAHNRSEAFGHQLWWGCYDNAFAMLRRCYKELGRPAGAPLATFKEAWKPAESVFFGTGLKDHDRLWPLSVGRNDAVPGEGDLPPSVWDYVQVLLPWVLDCLPAIHPEYPSYAAIAPLWQDQARSLLPALLRRAQNHGVAAFADFDPQSPDYDRLLRNPAPLEGPLTSRQRRAWAQPLVVGAEQSLRALEAAGARVHHPNFLSLLDLALAAVRGIIRDGLDRNPRGFSAADDHDLREWLRHHGASPASLAAPMVTGFYDLLHAPALAAGAGLRMILRIVLAHKGALYYMPQADLGEVVFAPLYQLLRRRGVRFRFFHKVKEMRVEDDRISAIRIGRQVEFDPGVDDYEPLINVKGLLCWPSRPLYAQIVLGDSPMIQALDFESAESPEIEEFTLRRGADFDDVILGIPAPALPRICAELVQKYPAWQEALAHADSVAVQGAQLWLSPTWAQLAGHATPVHAGTLPGTQLPRWANRSPSARLEQWPREFTPATVCALDGPLPDPAPGQPPPVREQLRETVWTWLKSHPRRLWPEASLSATRELNWELLIDTNGRTGDHRLAAQHYWSATAPTDRATLTLPGHTRHRLRATQSGLKNLLLAGDWLGDLVGVAESAVLTGFQVSRALCGHPQVIPGEADEVDLEGKGPGASQSIQMAASVP